MQYRVSNISIMLLVGTYELMGYAYNILSIKNNVYIVNLSSSNLKIKSSSLFYAPRGSYEDFNYDIEYSNYIFSNTEQRIEFLLMMNELLMGNDVLIMIGTFPGMYEMAESLLKMIQSRYGYNGYFILDPIDLENLDMYQSNFSVPGLQLFDQEKVELDEVFLARERR